eukprot:6190958-Pleurochrysis_carterae.AAC.6
MCARTSTDAMLNDVKRVSERLRLVPADLAEFAEQSVFVSALEDSVASLISKSALSGHDDDDDGFDVLFANASSATGTAGGRRGEGGPVRDVAAGQAESALLSLVDQLRVGIEEVDSLTGFLRTMRVKVRRVRGSLGCVRS